MPRQYNKPPIRRASRRVQRQKQNQKQKDKFSFDATSYREKLVECGFIELELIDWNDIVNIEIVVTFKP